MALPRSSLVGRPLGGPPPGRGDAREKPCCPPADGRAAGPIEARALAFLTLAPWTGEGLGLGLGGGLSEVILWCVRIRSNTLYARKASQEARGSDYSPEKRRMIVEILRVEVPRRGRKGSLGKPTSSRLADKVGRMGG